MTKNLPTPILLLLLLAACGTPTRTDLYQEVPRPDLAVPADLTSHLPDLAPTSDLAVHRWHAGDRPIDTSACSTGTTSWGRGYPLTDSVVACPNAITRPGDIDKTCSPYMWAPCRSNPLPPEDCATLQVGFYVGGDSAVGWSAEGVPVPPQSPDAFECRWDPRSEDYTRPPGPGTRVLRGCGIGLYWDLHTWTLQTAASGPMDPTFATTACAGGWSSLLECESRYATSSWTCPRSKTDTTAQDYPSIQHVDPPKVLNTGGVLCCRK